MEWFYKRKRDSTLLAGLLFFLGFGGAPLLVMACMGWEGFGAGLPDGDLIKRLTLWSGLSSSGIAGGLEVAPSSGCSAFI